MKIIGIICEYNPFHMGHNKQIQEIRSKLDSDGIIVCLMSGNYVQRGMPAIFDKSLRAKAAIDCGADLVLELPLNTTLSSAEGFAAGGVKILSSFCDYLCFGSETGSADALLETAQTLLSSDFSPILRQELETGCSFPAARQNALIKMGADDSLLNHPNDILAVEYCKAILAQNSALIPFPIHRMGEYHAVCPNEENPSATAIRQQIVCKKDWRDYIPVQAHQYFQNAPVHTMEAGERAVLSRLRGMKEGEFEALPYGSEGLWRKLMHACRSCATLDEIISATKSKRYTRTRLDRMIMCAYLNISKEMLEMEAPYVRVLGFRTTGIPALKKARIRGNYPHIGEKTGNPYEDWEQQWDDLYGLFCQIAPSSSGQTAQRRVYRRI